MTARGFDFDDQAAGRLHFGDWSEETERPDEFEQTRGHWGTRNFCCPTPGRMPTASFARSSSALRRSGGSHRPEGSGRADEFANLRRWISSDLRTKFDAVIGDFALPEESRCLAQALPMRVSSYRHDPLQRALALYTEGWRETPVARSALPRRSIFAVFLGADFNPCAVPKHRWGAFLRACDRGPSADTLYFDPMSSERFCEGYAHFTRTAFRPNALPAAPAIEVLAGINARSLGQFMRRTAKISSSRSGLAGRGSRIS